MKVNLTPAEIVSSIVSSLASRHPAALTRSTLEERQKLAEWIACGAP